MSERVLVVFRHGKSDWNASHGSDRERPLKERGIRAAERMGRHLTETEGAPDLVLASSAVRARRTAELAHESGGWTCPLRVLDELYGASPEAELELIRATAPEVRLLVVTGHEPTSSSLIAQLTGTPTPHFPTAAMAAIEVDGESWRDLELGAARLRWLTKPRSLG